MIKLTAQFYADDLRFNQLITHSGESPYVFRPKSNANVIRDYYQYTRPNRQSASSKHTLSGPQKTDSGLLMHYQPYS